MIHRVIIFGFICLSMLTLNVSAQGTRTDTLPQSASSSSSKGNPNILPLHQIHVGVTAGTQFTTTSGYGSGLSTYVSPNLTYRLSNRFSISGGISIVNTSLYGVKPWYSSVEGNSIPGFSGNFTQTTLWVSGQYLLGDHITITGTLYKTLDVPGTTYSNYPFYKSNPQGAHLNVGYKVNDHFHIEAGFGYSQGGYGYHYDPYNPVFGNSYNTPFYNR